MCINQLRFESRSDQVHRPRREIRRYHLSDEGQGSFSNSAFCARYQNLFAPNRLRPAEVVQTTQQPYPRIRNEYSTRYHENTFRHPVYAKHVCDTSFLSAVCGRRVYFGQLFPSTSSTQQPCRCSPSPVDYFHFLPWNTKVTPSTSAFPLQRHNQAVSSYSTRRHGTDCG